jgi:hypothetical protein
MEEPEMKEYTGIELGGIPIVITDVNQLSDEEIQNIIAYAKQCLRKAAMCQN